MAWHVIHTSTYFHSIPFLISMTTMNPTTTSSSMKTFLLQIVRFVCTNHGQSHCVVKRKYFINVDPSFVTNNHLKHPLEHSEKITHADTHTQRARERDSECGKETTTPIYHFSAYSLTKYLTLQKRFRFYCTLRIFITIYKVAYTQRARASERTHRTLNNSLFSRGCDLLNAKVFPTLINKSKPIIELAFKCRGHTLM